MIHAIKTETEDRGLKEAQILLGYADQATTNGVLASIQLLQKCINTNIGNSPGLSHLKHTPLSLASVVDDFYASNNEFISEDVDLDWMPGSYKEFCKYLQPSKTIFDLVEYDPFDYQVALAEQLDDPKVKTANVYKSRQTGLSEFIVSYILFRFLKAAQVNDQYSVLVYSTTQKDATALGDRMLLMYDRLIRGIEIAEGVIIRGPDFDRDSTTEKTLNGGSSKINFMATTGGRGNPAVDLVVVDESDFIPEIDKVLKAAKPTLGASGGKIVTITTPNGEGGYACKELNSIDAIAFSRTVEKCKEKGSRGWGIFTDMSGANVGLIVHYSAHPKYGEEWAEKTKLELKYDDASWNQEYELSTIASGSMFFDYKDVESCYHMVSKLNTDYRNIVIGVDPSGSGRDKTALVVWGERLIDGVKILIDEIYDAQMGSINTAEQVYQLYHKYLPTAVVVETNGVGDTVHELIENKLDGMCPVDRVHTSASHKVGILTLMRSEMAARQVGYRGDTNFRQELTNFLQKEKASGKFSYEARTGFNDDAIMASCHAINRMVNNPEPTFIGLI